MKKAVCFLMLFLATINVVADESRPSWVDEGLRAEWVYLGNFLHADAQKQCEALGEGWSLPNPDGQIAKVETAILRLLESPLKDKFLYVSHPLLPQPLYVTLYISPLKLNVEIARLKYKIAQLKVGLASKNLTPGATVLVEKAMANLNRLLSAYSIPNSYIQGAEIGANSGTLNWNHLENLDLKTVGPALCVKFF